MIDPAFPPVADLVRMMTDLDAGCRAEEQGVAAHVYEVGVDFPIELSLARDARGNLQIGASPPLYRENTSFLPSYHQIRFVAVREDDWFGDEHGGGDDADARREEAEHGA